MAAFGSAAWSLFLPLGQLGLMGALQFAPIALAAVVAAGGAVLGWRQIRAVPFGPQMAEPNPIVLGAAVELPSEGMVQRQRLRDLQGAGTGPPGILRIDQVIHVPPAAGWTPQPEQPCTCTAHGVGGAGGVCGRHCGCYGPTHMCLLCASISSLTAGGGVFVKLSARSRFLAAWNPHRFRTLHPPCLRQPYPCPRPFGANPHSAMDRFIAVLGYVLLHSGIRGGRVWYDQGPGLPDGVFQFGETVIFIDYESGDPNLEQGQRRPPGHPENQSVMQAACAAADADFRVFVLRLTDFAYLCDDSVTWVPRCTGGNPQAELCMTFRRLFVVLNYILPICTDPPANWDAYRVNAGGAGPRNVPTLRFWLDGFPFQPFFPPFPQMAPGLRYADVAAAVVASQPLPTAPAAGPAVPLVHGALLVHPLTLSGPAGFMPYPPNVLSAFSLSLGGAWAPVNQLYLLCSLRVFFASLLPRLPAVWPPPAGAAAAAAVGGALPPPQSLLPWMLTIADFGLIGSFFSHTFAPLPALKQAGPFRSSGDFSDAAHYSHPDYAALAGRPRSWVFEAPPAAAAAVAAAAAGVAINFAAGNPAAVAYGIPLVPPVAPHEPSFARIVIDPMLALVGPVATPPPAGVVGWPAGPPNASFL